MPARGTIKNPPILGTQYGRLKIVRDLRRKPQHKHYVECLCICGKSKICVLDSLKKGDTKSCGCIRRPNIKGNRYGYLTALKYSGEDRQGESIWLFKCVCGNKVTRVAAQAKAKNVLLHCGCKKLKPNQAAFNTLYSHYRGAALTRNLTFNLSKKLFRKLTESPCYYCGVQPSGIIKGPSFRRPYIYSGIDRVNNKIGYTSKNCVSCCKTCNVAKAMYTQEFFMDWAKKLYLNLKRKRLYV